LTFGISHPLQVFHIVRARTNKKEKEKKKKKDLKYWKGELLFLFQCYATICYCLQGPGPSDFYGIPLTGVH